MPNFYWKVFKNNIPAIISEGISIEFILIPIVIALYTAIALFLRREHHKNKNITRRIMQSISFVVFGLIFKQCLCHTKMVVWGTQDLFGKKFMEDI